MKRWDCIRSVYSGIKIPCLLLTFIMTAALFVATITFGDYRYYTYSRDTFQKAGLENSYYVTHFGSNKPTNEELIQEIQDAKKAPGVETVLYKFSTNPFIIDGVGWGCSMMSEDLCEAFPPDIYRGTLFGSTGVSSEGALEMIDASGSFSDVPLGKPFEIPCSDTATITAVLVGRIRYPYFTLDFGSAGDITAADFISEFPTFLVKDTPETRELLHSVSDAPFNPDPNYFVVFSQDASQEEINAYLNESKQEHYILSYQELMDSTNKQIQQNLRTFLPLPVFLLFLTMVSLFSISVIIIYRKASENAIWYLCGCSRARGMRTIFFCIGILGAIAAVINAVFIVIYPILGDNGILILNRFYVDGWNLLFILSYLLITLLIVFATSLLLQRRTSPLELLRRLDQ